MNFADYLLTQQQQITPVLLRYLPPVTTTPTRLHEAMHYAVLNGGKRIRPILVYLAGELAEADSELLDRAATAIEYIHCYSLVHDDLPAMDNDDLRRGKPTCHRAYDEATAILVGDALQSLAFKTLSQANTDSNQLVKMLQLLAQAAGSEGMAGGQMLDIEATGKKISLKQLIHLHQLKTGALISVSIQLGALAGTMPAQSQQALLQFAQHIGLAFQIQDDILNVEGDTAALGKQTGSDSSNHKLTFPNLLGLAAAKNYLQTTYQKAIGYLDCFANKSERLRQLAEFIIQRSN